MSNKSEEFNSDSRYEYLSARSVAWATSFGVSVCVLGLFTLAGHGCYQCQETDRRQKEAEVQLERFRMENGMVPVAVPGTSGVYWKKMTDGDPVEADQPESSD